MSLPAKSPLLVFAGEKRRLIYIALWEQLQEASSEAHDRLVQG